MNKPLQNRKIVLTRTKEQSLENIQLLTELGADVILFPTIKVVPLEIGKNEIGKLSEYQFIILTSGNAAQTFAEYLKANRLQLNSIDCTVVAVGVKTKDRCEELGIKIDLLPKEFTASSVVLELSKHEIKGKRVLIPASKIARTELKLGLEKLGAEVKLIPFYDVIKPNVEEVKEISRIQNEPIDIYIFTSPSTFNNFLELLDVESPAKFFEKSLVAAIGPTTAQAIEKQNVKVDIIPGKYTMDDVIKLIIDYYQNEIVKN